MNRTLPISFAIVIFLGAGIFSYFRFFGADSTDVNANANANSAACTLEAKVCPDGTAVGRTGPNCEFTECPAVDSILTETEARAIAERSCIKGGESLAAGIYNTGTKTWWYDANLNSTREGCNPACVVNEQTGTADINWRCMGLQEAE